MTAANPTTDAATVTKAIIEAVRDNPSVIEELADLGLPADLLRQFAPPPQPTTHRQPDAVPGWSADTFVLWARSNDGSSFLAVIDPDPVGGVE
jgi:hypothetical protein